MKTTKHFITAILLLLVAFSYGQDYAYVTADSGLTIREQPDVNASKIGKLLYNEGVEVLENTNIKLVVIDEGKKVSGEWTKVKLNEYNNNIGYVFNGYLSSKKEAKIINIKFPEVDILIKNLAIYDDDNLLSFVEKDTLALGVHKEYTPGVKRITLKNNKYKSVKILQRFENSVSIIDEHKRCDLTEWQHYYSDWKPIKKINSSRFETLRYTEDEWQQFIPVAIEELKTAALEHCNKDLATTINGIKDINEHPAKVVTSRVFLKFILTDFEDNSTEKTMVFTIPISK
ncbi:SH3 domain-containing protein [uncultured Lacinutrix sp.]|uniref:SH3 domain-containing protein n=1 Tax=uncultured Lacinutrix sp. TaxID=574032 RepID=UPI00260BA8F6|nr:SH3 domain-containing protein [uncultured Lacinutrix sp.]